MTPANGYDEVARLRLKLAELEGKYNRQAEAIRVAVEAFERGEDLTKRMNNLARLGGGLPRWSKEIVVEKIREWAELYGEPPTATEWNPGYAKAKGRPELVVTFLADDWPHSSTVQRIWGSWNKAIAAAGFEPMGPEDGSRRRLRPQPEYSERWPQWHGWEMTRIFRERAGLTQAEVYRRGGPSQGWVTQVEQGQNTNPQLRALLAFARAVDVRPHIFIEDAPEER